ncbi:MAG TPA: APC family permease, partial [Actinotalea sp.]|nr:APC family permease [Actinotalea sp.]
MSHPRASGDARHPVLARRLGTADAVVLGLAAMIGAGVFGAFAPAAGAAGAGLLLGLGIAGVVAFANATSSAQLAAQFPASGGTYVYGRERLGPWWGFVAGWGFVVGKTASLAAMAMTFGAYVAPGRERAAALGAVVALTLVGYRGVTRTARTARFLLAVVVGALAVAVAAGLLGGPPRTTGLGIETLDQVGWYGVLQSAGLLFFAFAGYARVATLGEEVRDPARTIPRAIVLSLGLAAAVYTGVAVMLLAVLGPSGIAEHADPIAAAVRASTWGWA